MGGVAAAQIARTFVTSYSAAINALDPAATTRHWSMPCLMLMAGQPLACESSAELEGRFATMLARLRNDGFEAVHFELTAVDAISPTLLAVSVRWQLLGGGDRTLLKLHNRYVLMRDSERWRAKTMTEHDRTAEPDLATTATEGLLATARQFVEEYRLAFRGVDPERVAPYWCAPTLALDAGGSTLCTTPEQVLAAFQQALPRLRTRGLKDVLPALKAVRPLGPHMFELAVVWDLVDTTGTCFKKLDNVYLLREVSGNWKFAAVYLA